jgi:hypothetical protein
MNRHAACAAHEALRVDDTGLTARKIEQILRDAGISKSAARAIVAHGFKAAVGRGDTADAEAVAELAGALRAAAKSLTLPEPKRAWARTRPPAKV